MEIIFLLVIVIHGCIHLIGFAEAFDWIDIEQLEYEIPTNIGLIWLLAFLLFAVTGTMYFLNNDYWWLPGMLAILTSQALIFNHWGDAKYGSIINLIILIVVISSYARFNFELGFERQSQQLLTIEDRPAPEIPSSEELEKLPAIVQKWLIKSGIKENSAIQTLHMTQKARMKIEQDSDEWVQATAKQTVQTIAPSFVWVADVDMFPIISVQAKDHFTEGKGEMVVKAHSMLSIDELSDNRKLDTASLQRFLSEIVLYPSAAIEEYINWDSLDTSTARANIVYKGIKASGVFSFTDDGDFVQFTTERYLDPANDSLPIPWTIRATEYAEKSGWRIPVSFKVFWTTDKGPWEWLQLEIEDISFNL